MRVKLKDLGEIITGNTPSKQIKEYWDSADICFVKPDIIGDSYINLITDSAEYLSETARSKARIVGKDSLFVTCIGNIGKIGIAGQGEYAFNQQINSIIPNKKVLPKYLAYALLFSKPQLVLIANAPVVPIINKSQFAEFEINIEEDTRKQAEIASCLDKVAHIISLRMMQLSSLDDLIKARFDEMFGNLDRYPMEPLDDNVHEMFIGPFGSALKNECFVDSENGYCIVYEQKHAIQKTMNVPTRYVDKKKYNELKRFSVYPGDIIVSCRGTIGEIYIVPDGAPLGIMHPSIMKIRLNTEKYDQKFFVLALEQYMEEHNNEAKGSGVKMAVTATTLGKALFVVPPMDVQKQFSAFVEQVDKSKSVIQKSIDKTQLLFDSLMQKYFR